MSDTTNTRVIAPVATISYPHIDAPQPGKKPTDKAKYSAAFVWAPGTDLSKLRAAVIAAATKFFGATMTVGNQTFPIEKALDAGVIKSPLRTDALAKGYPEGSTFTNARSERKPGVVYAYPEAPGSNKPAAMPEDKIKDELYAGAQVVASLTAFGYNTEGNKGVGFALNNIQKVGDGPRLDSHKAATDEFVADLSQTPPSLEALLGGSAA